MMDFLYLFVCQSQNVIFKKLFKLSEKMISKTKKKWWLFCYTNYWVQLKHSQTYMSLYFVFILIPILPLLPFLWSLLLFPYSSQVSLLPYSYHIYSITLVFLSLLLKTSPMTLISFVHFHDSNIHMSPHLKELFYLHLVYLVFPNVSIFFWKYHNLICFYIE